jgi:hypothetical protein
MCAVWLVLLVVEYGCSVSLGQLVLCWGIGHVPCCVLVCEVVGCVACCAVARSGAYGFMIGSDWHNQQWYSFGSRHSCVAVTRWFCVCSRQPSQSSSGCWPQAASCWFMDVRSVLCWHRFCASFGVQGLVQDLRPGECSWLTVLVCVF